MMTEGRGRLVPVHSDPDTRSSESTEGSSPERVAVTGYTIVLPGGWRRIPARDGTDKAIKGILDEVIGRVSRDLPRDKVTPVRLELQRRLSHMIKKARLKGA